MDRHHDKSAPPRYSSNGARELERTRSVEAGRGLIYTQQRWVVQELHCNADAALLSS